MSYYRPVRLEELIAWLELRDPFEDVETLASALLDRFDVAGPSNTAV